MTCPHCHAPLGVDARFCPACGRALAATETVAESSMPAIPAQAPALVGREIAGRFRILAKLGEGGMGAVYRGEQMSLKRQVAVKVLRPELSQNALILRRFSAEAEAVAKLDHPNTVKVYDFGQDTDGSLFIAMEFIEGGSLRSVMSGQGPMPPARALAIALQVAASLADAHAQSIVHRDLKPDNVMLQDRGRQRDVVRVLDFGIAKLRDDQRSTQQAMTQAGDMLGTPQYMAPEQIRGEHVDGRTDVYALGCMVYEMVTGRLPFEGTSVLAILTKHLMEVVVPPSQRRPDLPIPPAIDQVVMTAMAKEPASRPPTMEQYGELLAGALALVDPSRSGALPLGLGGGLTPSAPFSAVYTPPPGPLSGGMATPNPPGTALGHAGMASQMVAGMAPRGGSLPNTPLPPNIPNPPSTPNAPMPGTPLPTGTGAGPFTGAGAGPFTGAGAVSGTNASGSLMNPANSAASTAPNLPMQPMQPMQPMRPNQPMPPLGPPPGRIPPTVRSGMLGAPGYPAPTHAGPQARPRNWTPLFILLVVVGIGGAGIGVYLATRKSTPTDTNRANDTTITPANPGTTGTPPANNQALPPAQDPWAAKNAPAATPPPSQPQQPEPRIAGGDQPEPQQPPPRTPTRPTTRPNPNPSVPPANPQPAPTNPYPQQPNPQPSNPPVATVGTDLTPFPAGMHLNVPAGFQLVSQNSGGIIYANQSNGMVLALGQLIAGTNDPQQLANAWITTNGGQIKLASKSQFFVHGKQRPMLAFTGTQNGAVIAQFIVLYFEPTYRVGMLVQMPVMQASKDSTLMGQLLMNGLAVP